MEKSKKIVLFDIDHTIFNTSLYQSLCYLQILEETKLSDAEELVSFCHRTYKILRKKGPFRLADFIDRLYEQFPIKNSKHDIARIFADEAIIEQALYDDVEKVLQMLSNDITLQLGIFSAGSLLLQRAKIKSLLYLFKEEHIHISEVDKLKDIPVFLKNHPNYKIFIVDDLPTVLHTFKSTDATITSILMKRGDGPDREKIHNFVPDYTIDSFDQLVSIVTK
ncbi:MAG TPA: hypothetical protein VG935_03885 [Patescibacteria group bacterium]|nr:hypothetical protein [Patescibacteria group bacterium]